MGTITILKNDGIFTVADYLGKAHLRMDEIQNDLVHPIRRKATDSIEAYFLSKTHFDALEAAFAPPPIPSSIVTNITDDYVNANLLMLLDILTGREQVEARRRKIIEEGATADDYRVYNIRKSSQYQVDNSHIVLDDDTQFYTEIVGVMISVDHYQELV